MKKLFINPKGDIVVKDVRDPLIETKGSLVKTCYALISTGTELTILKGKKFENLPLYKRILRSKDYRKIILNKIKNKSLKGIFQLFRAYKKRNISKNFLSPSTNLKPLGYSCAGTIIESNLNDYKIDDKVACAGSNHAEIIFSPKNLTCKIPNNVSLEEASFTTLGAIAIHGIHRADIKSGEFVGVIGTGLIGLLTIQIAKACGAIVIALDLINKRLNLAKKLGSDFVINPLYLNSKIKINEITNGHGLDAIIICASSETSKPLEEAIEIIREKGKIVLLGGFPISVDRTELYMKEADLLISRSYGPGRYDSYYEYKGYDYPKEYVPWTEQRNMELFLNLISEKKIDVKSLISEIFPIEKANLAYNKLEKDPINNIAILLKFDEKVEIDRKFEETALKKSKMKKLVIGLIGCGAFAQSVHLPYLLSNPNCRIKAICTEHKKTAEFCKEKFRPEYVTTDPKKILKDPEIETVFIYTRHNTHAELSIEALKTDKNVFVEKPMGITINECMDVYKTVKMTKKNYTIGFNRRFSPLIKIAKELLMKRNNPIIINYRISNMFIPGTHWIFDRKVGGGPIIGEFCHFTDLILYLMNSNPIELYAVGGNLSHRDLELPDSCVVTIKFHDKSIANLIYSDLSGPNMPKERIEIFSGDSAIVINDFKVLKTFGFDIGNKYFDEQDKGHSEEILNIIKANLGEQEFLVNVDDALRAMYLCFKTIDSLKTNKIIQIEDTIYNCLISEYDRERK